MHFKLFFVLVTVNVFFISCGDILNYRKQIAGNYYLVESESKGTLLICYKTQEEDYVGRTPPGVLEYAFTDSFLIAKVNTDNGIKYYTINTKKDSQYANEQEYLVNIVDEQAFNKNKLSRSNIEFIAVRK